MRKVLVALALVFVGSCGDTQVGNQGEVTTPLTNTPDYKAQSQAELTDDDVTALRIAMIREIQESAPADYAVGKQASPRAENRAHRLRAVFEPAGIKVETAAWVERLELLAYGYDGEAKETSHGKRSVRNNRVEYLRDPNLTEWFLNGPLGIEHGFTLQTPPSGRTQASDLVFEIGVSGDLRPRQLEAGKSVVFLADGGAQAFQYREAYAQDADGRILPAHLDLDAARERVIIRVSDHGAAYPLTIDPLITTETKLVPPIALDEDDYFGREKIGLSGNTAVIGATGDDDAGFAAGAAYVFVYSGSEWTLQQKLFGSDATFMDFFGSSVAIDGDTIVVGSYGDGEQGSYAGAAYVFVRSGDVWSEQAKLLASDGGDSHYFGQSVAVDADTAVIGCEWDDETANDAGAAYVFVRSGITWTEQQKLLAGDGAAGDRLGEDVAVSGDSVIVGTERKANGGSLRGAAYVFLRTAGVWAEQQKLVPGDPIDSHYFGASVDIDGDTVAVGARADDDTADNAGAVYMFTRSGGVWTEGQKLFGSGLDGYSYMGSSVSLSGTDLLVGASSADGVGSNTGAAWVFVYSAGTWTEQDKLQASDGESGDNFHRGAIDGDLAVVAAYSDDDSGNQAGSAYMFSRSGSAWTQDQKVLEPGATADTNFGISASGEGPIAVFGAYSADVAGADSGAAWAYFNDGSAWSREALLLPGDAATGDAFGYSSAVSGNTAIIAAIGDDDNGSYSGSAYVYVRSAGVWTMQQKLSASDGQGGDVFGRSVAIEGDLAVVGADRDDDLGTFAGSAYVFRRSGGVWTEEDKLLASDGNDSDLFGVSVAVSGTTVLVGAPDADGGGAVYVFTESGGVWTEQQKLTGSSGFSTMDFGESISMEGDTAVIGAPLDGVSTRIGTAYIFTSSGGVWTEQVRLLASDPGLWDRFGDAVALSGDKLAIGAYGSDEPANDEGAVYIFVYAQGAWNEVQKITASDGWGGDQFGDSLAMSGDRVVVGAPFQDEVTTNAGAGYVYDLTFAINGTPCISGGECASRNCVDGFCCNTPCGGTTVDCQTCSSAEGASADGTCTLLGAGDVCRATAGLCDAEEVCDGTTTTCPGDGFVAGGTECRASAGICDVAESCTGSAAACPGDGFVAGGTQCRASAGICDVAESCTGSAAACPGDGFVAGGTQCRASAGICDVAESCTGSAAACPGDGFVAGGTQCRASAGICDVAESCTGSAAACPGDAFVAAGTECRASADVCDLAESCTGSAAACPGDALVDAGTECRASAGLCDVAESCTGLATWCPPDVFVPAGLVCRVSAGICDVAESCTGGAAACPGDAFVAAGTECRASAGVCDVAESCTGSAAACPGDAFVAAGTECRGIAGVCDVAESCTGGAVACPGDAFVAAGTECRGIAGVCDVAESCTGGAAACPGDAFVAAGTECRGSADICDVAESCTGGAAACPGDAFVAAGTECRGSAGLCDVPESCTGSDAACPADALAPDGTSCNDGRYCSLNDRCTSGTCAGVSRDCSDTDPCTADACDEANDNCTHLLVPVPGAEGPVGDATCGDSVDNDCDTLTDDNDSDCQNCTIDSDCEDSNACTINTCAGGLCQTSILADGSPCEDGLYCTVPDSCTGGVCGGVLRDCSAMSDQCHNGLCDDVGDTCYAQQLVDGTPCDDGLACSVNDQCTGGVCGGSQRNCSDGDACTLDTCDQVAGCVNAPLDCDDGDACTVDICDQATGCNSGTPVDCDDGDACTVDTCDSATGCNSDTPVDCDDGDACTVDICDQATGCNSDTPVDCDDGDACTVDSCDAAAGCNSDTPVDCDDGDACTVDTCDPATGCNNDTPLDCADGESCTQDLCDAVTGCSNPPEPDGTACQNGTCQSGVCVPEGTDGGVDGGADGGADGGQDGGQDAGADETKPADSGCGCQSGTGPTGLGIFLLMFGLAFFVRRRFSTG